MKVHTIQPDDSYAGVVPLEPEHALRVVGTGGFTGSSMIERWESLRFRLQAPQRRRGDFLSFTAGTFAFSERVRDAFAALLAQVGEILPIDIDRTPYFVLNVLRRVDALDIEHSKYTTFAGNKIFKIERHAFFPAAVHSESIFLVKQRRSVLYTTSDQSDGDKDFQKRVAALGYKGLLFKPVWSSAA